MISWFPVARAVLLISALATAAAPPLNAQDSARVSLPGPASTVAARGDTVSRYVVLKRAALGTLGWYAGAIAGAYTAVGLSNHDCHCDDPGFTEAVLGFAIGGTVGATTGAAIPGFGRNCGFGERLGRGFLGSVGGLVVGALASIATKDETGIIVVPVLSAAGASLMMGHC